MGINSSFVKATQTGTCNNPSLRGVVSVMTALAGVFSHSPCNNDAFKKLQTELDGLSTALGVLRRNDTRCVFCVCLFLV